MHPSAIVLELHPITEYTTVCECDPPWVCLNHLKLHSMEVHKPREQYYDDEVVLATDSWTY